jgi:hypothetical protein
LLRLLLFEAGASIDAGMDLKAMLQLEVFACFEGGVESYDRSQRDALALCPGEGTGAGDIANTSGPLRPQHSDGPAEPERVVSTGTSRWGWRSRRIGRSSGVPERARSKDH